MMVLMLKTRSNRVLSGDCLAVIDLAQPHSCVVHSRRNCWQKQKQNIYQLLSDWGMGTGTKPETWQLPSELPLPTCQNTK